MPGPLRHLIVVLGYQLDRASSAWDGFDATRDRAWMAEVRDEATHVPSSRQRTSLFLSAMRHFAQELQAEGVPLDHLRMQPQGLGEALARTLAERLPQAVVVTEPGEWRVAELLRRTCEAAGVPLQVREDRHFMASRADFERHVRGRKQLRMEYFYREMRLRHGVLMGGADGSQPDEPAGGQWNFDADNRESFGRDGPGRVPAPRRFQPDALTLAVMADVERAFPSAPGRLRTFGWPVTRGQALSALEDFITHRLRDFGRWQDAMWGGQPWLYHAMLASSLNLKLLNPREVIGAAEQAWRRGDVPLAAAEGFIRQILGWREYVRGVYGLQMPGYLERNALGAQEDLPAFYWSGDTAMRCLADAIGQTLEHGYAHHIQRLMVTGLYALLLGVRPQAVHAWYLAVYVDAVEWVEAPNTLGMSQYADGPGPDGRVQGLGPMASKPYIATGQYIARMSDHCRGCRFDPARRTGERACPFTTLYWDFLDRHRAMLARNPRMGLQVKNLARVEEPEMAAIRARAGALRARAVPGC